MVETVMTSRQHLCNHTQRYTETLPEQEGTGDNIIRKYNIDNLHTFFSKLRYNWEEVFHEAWADTLLSNDKYYTMQMENLHENHLI